MNEPKGAAATRPGTVMRALRRYLINGLLIWVPVLVTVLVVNFILQLMDRTLLVLPRAIRPDQLLGWHVPGLGAVLGLLIVLLTGLLVTNFIGQALVAIGEELLERIPFVRALYSGVKSFSETVLSNSGNSFKKVLLVEYPRAGVWTIGFQTTDHLPEINAHLGEAAGVRVHSDHAEPDLGLYHLRAARPLHRTRHARGRRDEDDRDLGGGGPIGAAPGGNCAAALRPVTSRAFPLQGMPMMRTHYCGQVSAALVGQKVAVAGWVHRRRDHGGVIFVDLRDREGLVQVVCNPDAAEVFASAEKLRNEFVVRVAGTVRARPAGTTNANLATGQVEIVASEVEILNRADPLPFQLDEQVSEEVRLRYRYLDLRREVMSSAPAPAARDHPGDARISRCARLYRHRNPDADQGHARGRARLPGAQPHARRQVLCAAAVTADLQAAVDDQRLRALLPDRALLSRRGPARRSPAGIHAARYRDQLPCPKHRSSSSWKPWCATCSAKSSSRNCPIRFRA